MARTSFRQFRPKLVSLAVASCFATGAALANPTNPQVVHGAANFTNPAANVLNITTATPQTIINWGGFSIAVGELTKFLQPSAASAVLNRVVGSGGAIDPSVILGALQSNGRVFLVNPSGILFGAGAQIDVAGLVATSMNLSNADFLANRLKFTEVPGAGSVINQGNITTGQGGQVYLVGPAVTNNGIITSPQGEVVLAAGNTVELVNPGTPNLRVEITAAENEAKNLGSIIVDSGRAGIYAGLVNNAGTIRADSVVSEGGRIMLKAAKNVTLEATSVLSAQGVGGGRIEVLADNNAYIAGTLDASAPNGGDGGFIETSGKNRVSFGPHFITTSAPHGRTGTWLIDPNDFTIGSVGDGCPSDICDISGAQLGTDLATNHITILSSVGAVTPAENGGNVFVLDPVSWSSGNNLTLTAIRNVEIFNGITNTGTGSLFVNSGWDGSNATGAGDILVNSNISVGGGVNFQSGRDIKLNFSSVDAGGNIDFKAGQDIILNAGRAWAGAGSPLSDRSLAFTAGRHISLLDPDGGSTVDATTNTGNATVTLTATAGDITIEGSEVYAVVNGSGGSAKVSLKAGQDINATQSDIYSYNNATGSATTELDAGRDINFSGTSTSHRIHASASNGTAKVALKAVRNIGADGGEGSGAWGSRAVINWEAGGTITANNTAIETYATGGQGSIVAMAGGGDITINAGELAAEEGFTLSPTLVAIAAGGNITVNGPISSSGADGGEGWFLGFLPPAVASIIPATTPPNSFDGVVLNAGNRIIGGTGTVYSSTNTALQAVNGIGTVAAPLQIVEGVAFDSIAATNTGASGDIALRSPGSVELLNGSNLLNANPTGTYYIEASQSEGSGEISLFDAFTPGGSAALPGQKVHFKAVGSNPNITLVGGGTGSITGAGQVTLETNGANGLITLDPGTSISATNVLLKSNKMDIQGTVTATNNVYVTPFTAGTAIELGGFFIDGALALSSTSLGNLFGLGLGIGTDGTTANTGNITVTGAVGPFNAFPNFFGMNFTQGTLAPINSPGGLNAFTSGDILLNHPGNNIGSFGGTAGTNINIATIGDISLGVVTAGSSVNIASSGGAILNTSGLANITSPTVSLSAATGIGSVLPVMLTNASPSGVTAINSTSGGIGLLQPNGTFTLGSGGWNVQNAPGGEIIIEGMNITLGAGAPNSGPLEIFASNDAIVGPAGYASTNPVFLSGLNHVNVNGNLSASNLALFAGESVNINGAAVTATGLAAVAATKLNITAGTTAASLTAGDLVAIVGEINLQGGTGTNAFAEIKAGPGQAPLFITTFASGGTTGDINLNGGAGSGAYARIYGDPDVGSLLLPVLVGGVINMTHGTGTGSYARIESASANSIFVDFLGLTSGGFFVNGVENAVSSGGSGFFAGGQPAVLGQNLLVTYGGLGSLGSLGGGLSESELAGVEQAINQVIVATNNTQSDLIGGDPTNNEGGVTDPKEEKDKKGLPVCGK